MSVASLNTVWDILLQHPAICSEQRIVCCLLQVSKGMKVELQQCQNHLVQLQLQSYETSQCRFGPLATQAALADFAAWIPKHAGLVHSIDVGTSIFSSWRTATEYEDEDGHHDAGMDLLFAKQQAQIDAAVFEPKLQRSLRLAASVAPTGATPALGPSAFNLQSFSTDFLIGTAVLSALPAATLTQLKLLSEHACTKERSYAAALCNLSRLQHLTLASTCHMSVLKSSLKQLRQLTSLTVAVSTANSMFLTDLPQQLQELQLTIDQPVEFYLGDRDRPSQAELHLDHLTSLQCLELMDQSEHSNLICGSKLPSQLKQLTVSYPRSAHWPRDCQLKSLGITLLYDLQVLTLIKCCNITEDLRLLTHLRNLQHLSLTYNGTLKLQNDLGVAAVWRQLPLKHLSLDVWLSAQQTIQLLEGVGQVVTLTSLEYMAHVRHQRDEPSGDNDLYEDSPILGCNAISIPTCELLTGLTNLCQLKLGFGGGGYLLPGVQTDDALRYIPDDSATLQTMDTPYDMDEAELLESGQLGAPSGSGCMRDAQHLTALQQLTSLDLRSLHVPCGFVSSHVAQFLALSMTQLQELHLAPGDSCYRPARFGLGHFAWAIAGLTRLKNLSIAGAKEQDPTEPGFPEQLHACLWTLSTLTRLTMLDGFGACFA